MILRIINNIRKEIIIMKANMFTILALSLLSVCVLTKPNFLIKNNKIYDENGG